MRRFIGCKSTQIGTNTLQTKVCGYEVTNAEVAEEAAEVVAEKPKSKKE
jgi:hypothetical protein